jgi:hypothetical protein
MPFAWGDALIGCIAPRYIERKVLAARAVIETERARVVKHARTLKPSWIEVHRRLHCTANERIGAAMHMAGAVLDCEHR